MNVRIEKKGLTEKSKRHEKLLVCLASFKMMDTRSTIPENTKALYNVI